MHKLVKLRFGEAVSRGKRLRARSLCSGAWEVFGGRYYHERRGVLHQLPRRRAGGQRGRAGEGIQEEPPDRKPKTIPLPQERRPGPGGGEQHGQPHQPAAHRPQEGEEEPHDRGVVGPHVAGAPAGPAVRGPPFSARHRQRARASTHSVPERRLRLATQDHPHATFRQAEQDPDPEAGLALHRLPLPGAAERRDGRQAGQLQLPGPRKTQLRLLRLEDGGRLGHVHQPLGSLRLSS